MLWKYKIELETDSVFKEVEGVNFDNIVSQLEGYSTTVSNVIKQLNSVGSSLQGGLDSADRCINGKDWKKIVSVSDKVKSDLEKVVKQDFISSNGAFIPEESKRHRCV